MGANSLQCNAGCRKCYDWTTLIQRWGPDFRCDKHGQPLRWFNEWSAAKASKTDAPVEYEVLFVARLDERAPYGNPWKEDGEAYLPVLLVCRDQSNNLVLWPRYWVRPGKKIQFGQDGPLLSVQEWDYLMEKVRRFLANQTALQAVSAS